jgi:hypothetical protein
MTLRIPVITPDGVIWVPADDLEAQERSVDASHVNSVTLSLETGDFDRMRDFEGVRLGGLALVTDQQDIEDLDDRGELGFSQFYWQDKTP